MHEIAHTDEKNIQTVCTIKKLLSSHAYTYEQWWKSIHNMYYKSNGIYMKQRDANSLEHMQHSL